MRKTEKGANIRIAKKGGLKDSEELRCKNPTSPRSLRDFSTQLPSIFQKYLKTSKLPERLSNQENEEYTDLLILSIYFTDHSILSG
jgi:hypothetical protein